MSQEIWLEKYRPQHLDDVQGNDLIISNLKRQVQDGNIPHMILVGPPGIGKTTSILCLAKQILGSQFKQACIELNASDDRGIEVVRSTIKSFSQRKVILQPGQHKIIILDEADSLTEGAQQALRCIISDYSDTTRFVLSCNDSSKLIDPIQSRCSILRFSKLTDEQVLKRLQQIITCEKINAVDSGIEALIYTADGDMRQAINNLQATSTFGLVNKDNVFKVCDVPNLEIIQRSIDSCVQQDYASAQRHIYLLTQEGHSVEDLVNHINKIIINHQMDDETKFHFLNEMAKLKIRTLNGLATFVQLSGFLANCCTRDK